MFIDFSNEEQTINQCLANSPKYTELKKVGIFFFQGVILFHPSHPQQKITNISLCILLIIIFFFLNHYVNLWSIQVFLLLKGTQKIGDTEYIFLKSTEVLFLIRRKSRTFAVFSSFRSGITLILDCSLHLW